MKPMWTLVLVCAAAGVANAGCDAITRRAEERARRADSELKAYCAAIGRGSPWPPADLSKRDLRWSEEPHAGPRIFRITGEGFSACRVEVDAAGAILSATYLPD
jgi:hypothetical protein